MGRVELPFVRGGLPRAALVLPSRVRPVWWGIAALAAAVWIIVATQASVDVFILNSALLAILGAVALNVLMGTAGQPSIGNAAFLAVGGYAAVFLLRTHYFAFPFDVIGAGVISAVVGLVVGV
ncbi:MAG TPA: hypothetical protein VK816_08895, partial [Jatrophihabitantaceae bacterium]|nr:hypothetical protein [Jatrophihabitantaceae bacterium]